MIAFLGTGLMGSAFVRALLDRGKSVTVWNRTAAKAQALAADGAKVSADPAEAVRGAKRVHLSLLDDSAVDAVLDLIIPSLEPGAIVLDHSTTAPQPTAQRAQRLAERGVAFLHAPVFMGPANARDGSGFMLAAGPQKVYDRVRPALARMTGKLRYFGERPDLAAGYKLFGNMMIMFVVSGIADVFALAKGLGVDPQEACTLFDDFNPAGQVSGRGRRMAEKNFEPTFELSAARKDVRLMLETASATGASLHILPSIAHRFDEVIAAGHGKDDLASIVADDVA
jgi:3-hydroxyisobutyrate dehydrogenase